MNEKPVLFLRLKRIGNKKIIHLRPMEVIEGEMIDMEGEKWVTSATLSRALGYKDTKTVSQLYNKHEDWFQDGIDTVVLPYSQFVKFEVVESTTSKKRMVRLFSFTGGLKICRYSGVN